MKLIVGLGNLGNIYNNTRHNVGFMAIDKLCSYYGIKLDRHKFNGNYGEGIINGIKVMLLKPEKYMNLSGEVVAEYVKFFKISIDDILIINDDLDLPLGRYKIKYKGSSGGHNGLKNIELHLNTKEYKRIKIGISNNKSIDTKDYVLGKFSQDELNILNKIFDNIPNIIGDYVIHDFDFVMNRYNRNDT